MKFENPNIFSISFSLFIRLLCCDYRTMNLEQVWFERRIMKFFFRNFLAANCHGLIAVRQSDMNGTEIAKTKNVLRFKYIFATCDCLALNWNSASNESEWRTGTQKLCVLFSDLCLWDYRIFLELIFHCSSREWSSHHIADTHLVLFVGISLWVVKMVWPLAVALWKTRISYSTHTHDIQLSESAVNRIFLEQQKDFHLIPGGQIYIVCGCVVYSICRRRCIVIAETVTNSNGTLTFCNLFSRFCVRQRQLTHTWLDLCTRSVSIDHHHQFNIHFVLTREQSHWCS